MRLHEKYQQLCGEKTEGLEVSKPTNTEVLNFLYGCLGILDSKASHLMRVDALLMTIASIFLIQERRDGIYVYIQYSFLAVSLLCVGSILFSMRVISIKWDFLGRDNLKSELNDLEKEVKIRHRCYNWSWRLSLSSVIIIGLVWIVFLTGFVSLSQVIK